MSNLFFIKKNWICAMTKHAESSITLFFYENNVIRTKALVLAKHLRTKSGLLAQTSGQSLAVTYIVLHID